MKACRFYIKEITICFIISVFICLFGVKYCYANNENYVPIYVQNSDSQIEITQRCCGKNINGKIMIRALGIQDMGVNVFCDNSLGEIVFKRVDKEIEMNMGSNFMLINGVSINIDCQPRIIDNEIYVPVKALYEALGCTVEWNNDTKGINIITGDIKIGVTIVTLPADDQLIKLVDENNIYDKNYIEEYRDIFDKMFPLGWEVQKEQEYITEDFMMNNKLKGYIYYEILYKNSANEYNTFYMRNDCSIGENILNNILDKTKFYYEEKYLNLYLRLDNVDCKIDFSIPKGYSTLSNSEIREAYNNYCNNLCNNIIDFSTLDFENIFEVCPIYANVDVNVDISYSENIEEAQQRIDLIYSYSKGMVEKIIEDTGSANIELEVKADFNKNINAETKEYKVYYVNGLEYEIYPNVLTNMEEITYERYKETLFNF